MDNEEYNIVVIMVSVCIYKTIEPALFWRLARYNQALVNDQLPAQAELRYI